MSRRSKGLLHAAAAGAWLLALTLGPRAASAEVTFDWVVIGDAGNAPDDEVMTCCDEQVGTTGYGSVPYVYEISRTEVTNAQYAEFLNAVDPTGVQPMALFDWNMVTDPTGGILYVFNNPEGQKYELKPGAGDKAVNYVSFFDALRFINWLSNGQGNGDTENGTYTLIGPNPFPGNAFTVVRNPRSKIFLPRENEWYKAAFYDTVAKRYYDYPEGSDDPPTCSTPTTEPHTANCNFWVNDVTPVGSYPNSGNPNGLFDMGGNIIEWNEAILPDEVAPDSRGCRGGGWSKGPSFLAAGFTYGGCNPSDGEFSKGFRVARAVSGVPSVAPGSLALLGGLLAASALVLVRRRRR